MKRTQAAALACAAVAAVFVAVLGAVLNYNDGQFVYSLDDPYIHLAVSDQIRALEYGLNPGEFSTPSSSVLWPVLLAVGVGLPGHEFLPLGISFASLLATVVLLMFALWPDPQPQSRSSATGLAALVAVLTIGLNLVGVAFTGMEHSLHVLVSVAASAGLAEVARSSRAPWWFWVGVTIGPLLRYEGLAVSAAALGVALWFGYRREVAVAAAAIAASLGAFSLMAVLQGLEPLPSSVLVKNTERVTGWQALEAALRDHGAFAVLVLLVAIGGAWSAARSNRPALSLSLFALVVLVAHGLFGRFGWFGRYELYAYASVVPILAHIGRQVTVTPTVRLLRPWVAALPVVALLAGSYTEITIRTPLATHNVYLQQAQTADLVKQLGQELPVAVNDIGLVAYRHDGYVLDLWGLANSDAREQRLAQEPGWMDQIMKDHGVAVAVVYDDWFPELPTQWELVAKLTLDVELVSVARDSVSFYVRPGHDTRAVRAVLTNAVAQMPDGATLRVPFERSAT